MLPPSRGRRKAGAFAPSANAELRAADVSAFAPDGFLAGGFPASGFAAVAFDRVVLRGAVAPDDFNCFDGALCDAPEIAFPGCLVAFLPDLFAIALRVFEGGVFADLTD